MVDYSSVEGQEIGTIKLMFYDLFHVQKHVLFNAFFVKLN